MSDVSPTAAPPEITAIESEAEGAGVKMADVLTRADVASTTWWRWKTGAADPRLKTLRKVRNALTEIRQAVA